MTTQPLLLTTTATLRQYRWRLALTYSLTLIENLLELLYPLMIGIGINGLLDGRWTGLLPLGITWLLHTLMAGARQIYDTRIFSAMYQQLATGVIVQQAEQGAATSQLAARSGLMREFIDFLEDETPFIVAVIFSFVGAFIMLAIFDWVVAAYCLFILVPLVALNHWHRRTTLHLNQQLNDRLEEEVQIIETADEPRIREHYGKIKRWNIRLSDADARTWVSMQPFLLGLIILALLRSTGMGMSSGEIFTVLSYALGFTESLDNVPMIVQQYSRLQDITRRVNADSTPARDNA